MKKKRPLAFVLVFLSNSAKCHVGVTVKSDNCALSLVCLCWWLYCLLQVTKFDYGMQHHNPVDHVRFYTKSRPDIALHLRKNQVSATSFSVKSTVTHSVILCFVWCLKLQYILHGFDFVVCRWGNGKDILSVKVLPQQKFIFADTLRKISPCQFL